MAFDCMYQDKRSESTTNKWASVVARMEGAIRDAHATFKDSECRTGLIHEECKNLMEQIEIGASSLSLSIERGLDQTHDDHLIEVLDAWRPYI